jgi:hypothetical protein
MRNIALLLLLAYSNAIIAETCSKPVISLLATQPAPCTGFLFSKEEEAKVRKNQQDLTIANQQIGFQNSQIEIYKSQSQSLLTVVKQSQDQSEVWRKAAIESSEKYISEANGRATRDFLFFGGGALAGILAVILGAKATQAVK